MKFMIISLTHFSNEFREPAHVYKYKQDKSIVIAHSNNTFQSKLKILILKCMKTKLWCRKINLLSDVLKN